jgi:phage host-nuclease inhibitor protein Gam
MSKNRIKKTVNTVQTREEAEARMRDLANATNERIAIVAEMDKEILAVKEAFEQDLAIQDARIKEASDDLEAWALAHPELFQKPKSVAFLSGVIGFRTGTPALALLNRKWNWELVTAAVAKVLPAFIRQKPEVDKAAILSQREELAEFLPLVGLKVSQGETVYVEPTLTPNEVAA